MNANVTAQKVRYEWNKIVGFKQIENERPLVFPDTFQPTPADINLMKYRIWLDQSVINHSKLL